jgi:hypothetical protein
VLPVKKITWINESTFRKEIEAWTAGPPSPYFIGPKAFTELPAVAVDQFTPQCLLPPSYATSAVAVDPTTTPKPNTTAPMDRPN